MRGGGEGGGGRACQNKYGPKRGRPKKHGLSGGSLQNLPQNVVMVASLMAQKFLQGVLIGLKIQSQYTKDMSYIGENSYSKRTFSNCRFCVKLDNPFCYFLFFSFLFLRGKGVGSSKTIGLRGGAGHKYTMKGASYATETIYQIPPAPPPPHSPYPLKKERPDP